MITDFLLVERGVFREAEFISLLGSGRYPARNPAQNLGDIRAQIAANEKGDRELNSMIDQFGFQVVKAYMAHVRANASEQVRRVIDRLKPGRFVQKMDFGGEIHVQIGVDANARTATIDFTGTSAQSAGNFNAPSSIVQAAVLYVFRTLVNEDIPLNDGCLEALKIVIPPDSMLAPRAPAAVVAGNVETSQAVTNALYGALGVLAAAQGTMNNLTFGNSQYQYYETICGGAGAGPGFEGASAVHTHMTNSRLTDPEVLELRYPVLIEAFRVRRDSGGRGRWSGGDGVVRRIRFREPMIVAVLANNRVIAPFGLEGGDPGMVGKTYIQRADGRNGKSRQLWTTRDSTRRCHRRRNSRWRRVWGTTVKILFTADLHLLRATQERDAVEGPRVDHPISAGRVRRCRRPVECQQAGDTLKNLRGCFPQGPIAVCLGNHDFWTLENSQREHDSLSGVIDRYWAPAARSFDIVLLDGGNLHLQDIAIVGGYGHYDLGFAIPGLAYDGILVTEEDYLRGSPSARFRIAMARFPVHAARTPPQEIARGQVEWVRQRLAEIGNSRISGGIAYPPFRRAPRCASVQCFAARLGIRQFTLFFALILGTVRWVSCCGRRKTIWSLWCVGTPTVASVQ